MNIKILGISLMVLSIGMMANAYAHTMEVVGDYKIEVGWENEPPVVGHDNAITLEVGIATDYDKAQAEAEDKAMEEGGMDNMTGDSHDHTMTSTEGGTAEQEHQMALDLEKQGKYADAAEHHHMAATDLEKAGDYAGAAEHHHMAATDLEKAGDYAGAAEHHNMAAADLDKAGKHTEAIEHEHMATKDLAMSGTSTAHEEEHDMTTKRGLLDNFTVDVTIGDTTTPLKLVENSKFPGVYSADFTPSIEGSPLVHVVGKLAGEDVDLTFHPEAVEGMSALSPLKQVKEGVTPKDVECKTDHVLLLKISDGSPACVNPATAEKLEAKGWGTKA